MFSAVNDYMNISLRQQVEALKASVQEEPTTPETLLSRGKLLWEWANSFSLTGIALPVECSFFMTSVFVGSIAGEFSVLKRDPVVSSNDLDQMIEELTLKEEHFGSLGTFALTPKPPMIVNSLETFQQVFSVGTLSLLQGGGFLIARNGFVDHGIPQHENPSAENYVSVHTSRAGATFRANSLDMRGLRGGIRAPIPVLFFELAGSDLVPGDTVTITYGDTSKGSAGFRVQSTSTDGFKLPIYVDFVGNRNFLTFESPGFEVVGGKAHSVHGFVPSVIRVGESFEMVLRTEDFARNRATGIIPGYEISLNDELIAHIPSGGEAIVKVDGLSTQIEGTYRFKITSTDGVVCFSDPVWVKKTIENHIYWGDLHGHCEFADGQGSPDAYFQFGRDDARLDFLCLSEHDVFLDDFKWKHLQDCLARYEEESSFVPLLAYEWTAPPGLGGHHNVYFRKRDGEIVGLHEAHNLGRLFEALKQLNEDGDVLVIPHAHQIGDWRKADAELVAGVEIVSQHGAFEWFGQRYLDFGHHVGFVGGSDNHQGHPGYSSASPTIVESKNGLTGALATSLSSNKVFSAIRDRSVYATSGERILLNFSIDGIGMGGTVPKKGPHKIHAAIAGTAALNKIEIVRGNKIIFTRKFGGTLGQSNVLRVAFHSPSSVVGHDNPRGYRIWKGWLDFGRDLIQEVDTSHLFNFHMEHAEIQKGVRSRIEFEVHTRGQSDAIFLKLDELLSSDVITIHLEETIEIADSRFVRARDTMESIQFELLASELVNGPVSKEIYTGSYCDVVELDILDLGGTWDSDFIFEDTEEIEADGEHYRIRIEQIDGATAWSSPIAVTSGASRARTDDDRIMSLPEYSSKRVLSFPPF
jgi:hypothetical protein